MTGRHSDSCDMGPWEDRAIDQLAELIRSTCAAAGPAGEVPRAVAEAVWSELTDTAVGTGGHPARDLTAWYLLANVGAHMLEVFDAPPEVAVVLIPRHALGQYLQANLDRLRVANLEPADLIGSTDG